MSRLTHRPLESEQRGVPIAPAVAKRLEIIQRQLMHEQVRKYGRSSLVNQPIGRILAADEGSGVTKKQPRSEAVPNEPIPTFTAVSDGQVDEE